MTGRFILFFDDECMLCNKSVAFIVKRDKKKKIGFASLHSDIAEQKLKAFKLDSLKHSSLILISGNKVYQKSSAVLKTAMQLGLFWTILSIIGHLIPLPIRDSCYDWIATNRYRWFGKGSHCAQIHPEWKERFLDL